MSTMAELLGNQARVSPNLPALSAPGRKPVSYGGLLKHVEGMACALGRRGIGRQDRVAIVLPNGPEMAAAFLSVCVCATAAPLNPHFRAAEFEFYLSDLQPRALLLESGRETHARGVADRLGIPVLELHSTRESPAGCFTLDELAQKRCDCAAQLCAGRRHSPAPAHFRHDCSP